MSQFIVKDTSKGNERTHEKYSEAEETKSDLVSLGANPEDIEIIATEQTDGGETDVEEVEPVGPSPETVQEEYDLPDKPDLSDDPVDWMPSHFVDEIQGVPTLNRKGYAVMAERFNVSVTSEPVVRASETDFEYAEFRATATTEDGTEYSGFGSAHVDRNTGDGGDDKYLLNELAQTRAMKRAASWALGVGMTARAEMTGEL